MTDTPENQSETDELKRRIEQLEARIGVLEAELLKATSHQVIHGPGYTTPNTTWGWD